MVYYIGKTEFKRTSEVIGWDVFGGVEAVPISPDISKRSNESCVILKNDFFLDRCLWTPENTG